MRGQRKEETGDSGSWKGDQGRQAGRAAARKPWMGSGEAWRGERSLWPKLQEGEGVRQGSQGNEAWRVLCASVLKMLQDPEQVGSAVGFRVCWKPPSPSPRGSKATPKPVVTKASAKF